MKLPSTIRRRHHVPLMVGFATLGAIALSFPSIQSNSDRWGRLTSTVSQEAQMTELMKARHDALGERSKIADERLKGGCNVIPLVWDKPEKATVITEGLQIKNPDNGALFPAGTVACDPYGNTGEVVLMADGSTVIGNVSSTTNFQLVKNALAMHGLTMRAGDPNMGASGGRAK